MNQHPKAAPKRRHAPPPPAGRGPVTPEQLLRYDFLVAERGCTSRMLVDRFGRDLPAGAQQTLLQGSLAALLRLIGHGHGVTLLPEPAVTRELREGELVELPLTEPIRPVSIVARWRARLGPAEAALRTLLDVARRADPLPEVTAASDGPDGTTAPRRPGRRGGPRSGPGGTTAHRHPDSAAVFPAARR
ncbi:LysR substrate-binding domain-containing protein [Streptomyces echinatus]|uniref:substrate-binding domain-containing protein n=1 Tax=Streptomyces echinatus TaxID=67293 RepID=UPI001CEC2E4F